MSTIQLPWSVATLFAILTVGYGALLSYRYLLHPLAHIPGPLEAKLSETWRNTRYWRGNWHEDVLALHKRYGPAVRIAPNEVSLVDAQALRLLYNHGTKASKTIWYASWQADTAAPGIFPARDKKLHAFLRKRVTPAYSMSATLKTYEDYIQELLDLFMAKVRGLAQDHDGKMDLARWTNHLGFDIIATLGYGEPLGMLETDSDVMDVQKNIHTAFFLVNGMAHYWGGAWWIKNKYTQKLTAMLGIPDPFATFEGWSLQRALKRKLQSDQGDGGGEMRQDMLSHFIRMKSEDGKPARIEEVLVEMVNLIGAGADTTSISMRVGIYYLCQHPSIYRRVQEEVDAYYRENDLRYPMSYQQTLELPLFCAVVREASRIFPAIPAQLPRSLSEDLVVGGLKIPAGTPVSMSPAAANRDPLVYGDDADHFKPERWLNRGDSDEERLRYLNAHDLTFGGTGSRTCLGKSIALVQLHKFLAQFLHHFDVELADPLNPFKVHTMFFANVTDMHVRVKYRGNVRA